MDQQMGEPQQEAMPLQDHQKDGSQEKAKDKERDEPHQEHKPQDEEEEKPGAHQDLQEGDKDEPHEELQEELQDAPHEEAKDANQEAQEEPKDDPQKDEPLVEAASHATQDEAEAEGGTPHGVCKLRLVSTNASWPKPRKTLQSSYRKLAGGLLLVPSGTSREAIRMGPDIDSMWLCSRVARNP